MPTFDKMSKFLWPTDHLCPEMAQKTVQHCQTAENKHYSQRKDQVIKSEFVWIFVYLFKHNEATSSVKYTRTQNRPITPEWKLLWKSNPNQMEAYFTAFATT